MKAAPQLLRHGVALHELVHDFVLGLGVCVHARQVDYAQAGPAARRLLVKLIVQRGPQRQALHEEQENE